MKRTKGRVVAVVDTEGRRTGPLTSSRFRRAACAVVEDAVVHVGDVAWVVTRTDGEDLIVLCAAGEAPTVKEGERIRVHPDEDVSVPLELPDGSLFGTLCALGGAGQHAPLPLVQVQRLADLLTAILAAEWEADESAERADSEFRRADRHEHDSLHDSLTELANRRAWDLALETEERRCRRYAQRAAVIVVDVDELKKLNDSRGHGEGDRTLRTVARTLETTSRDTDMVARIGGDEFAILALDCGDPSLRVLTARVRRALAAAGVASSVGGACRIPGAGLPEAWAQADAAMYADKHRRRITI